MMDKLFEQKSGEKRVWQGQENLAWGFLCSGKEEEMAQYRTHGPFSDDTARTKKPPPDARRRFAAVRRDYNWK
jgi:hypothetical protein